MAQTLINLGAIQGVILSVIIWNYPQQHKVANRILSLFLLSLVYLYVGPQVLELVDSPFQRLYFGFRMVTPILLILYIQSLYKKVPEKKYLLLFLLVPIDILVIYLSLMLRSNGYISSLQWGIINQSWFFIIFLFYLKLIFTQFNNYKTKVLQNLSSTHQVGLRWLSQLFFGFLFIVSFDFLLSVISTRSGSLDANTASILSILAFTMFMYFITIKGKLSPQIYQLRNLEDSPITDNKPIHVEDVGQLNLVSEKVIHLMETEKFFREEGLSVKDVADKIEEQPYIVSQAINSCLGKNFFELVNGYRVEESKNLMMDEKLSHLSMIGIAFEAGFSSKTAFNTAFKKHTGMTPSQFKKEALF